MYNYHVTVKIKLHGGKIMTDERFIYEFIRDLRENLEKSAEQLDEDVKALIVTCILKRTYERVERLQEQINKESRDFSIELLGDKRIRICKKQS